MRWRSTRSSRPPGSGSKAPWRRLAEKYCPLLRERGGAAVSVKFKAPNRPVVSGPFPTGIWHFPQPDGSVPYSRYCEAQTPRKPHRHAAVEGANVQSGTRFGPYAFFTGQVFKPSTEYSGQTPTAPVTSGTRPIHAQTGPPANAHMLRPKPSSNRALRSMPPTFIFIFAPHAKCMTAAFDTQWDSRYVIKVTEISVTFRRAAIRPDPGSRSARA